jgi:hypothetical protein
LINPNSETAEVGMTLPGVWGTAIADTGLGGSDLCFEREDCEQMQIDGSNSFVGRCY